MPVGVTTMHVVVVAGGGGSGICIAGGGGAGGMVEHPSYPVVPGGNVQLYVGQGGIAIEDRMTTSEGRSVLARQSNGQPS